MCARGRGRALRGLKRGKLAFAFVVHFTRVRPCKLPERQNVQKMKGEDRFVPGDHPVVGIPGGSCLLCSISSHPPPPQSSERVTKGGRAGGQ